MDNFFSVSSVFILIGSIALGCLYAWAFYGKNKSLNKNLRITLAVLRIAVVAFIIYLLFSPLVKRVSYILEKPVIVIAHDNSISVAQIEPKGFDQKKYQQDLKMLTTELGEKYEVKAYSFSDSVKKGLDFSGTGKLSNANALVGQLNDELLNRNVGAIIIASDGIFNRGGNPLYELDKIKAPVYTIAMGDSIPKRDVLIANVNYNNLVYLDNEFTLAIQVQAFQSKGESTQIVVSENGNKLNQQLISISANSFVKEVELKLKANKIGIHQYTVNVSAVKNEITTKNNSQTIFIEVIDTRQKILLAAAAPHPDLGAIKHAIELNKHYEVTLALADDLRTIDPNRFSLAILYQLPVSASIGKPLIDILQASKIPQFFILGSQTSLSTFNQSQNVINFRNTKGFLQEIFPYEALNFTSFNIDKKALKQLNNYDPLQIPFGSMTINGNYSALLNQRIGKVNTQTPMWFFTSDNSLKLGFLIGEGIWKWKLEEAKDEKNYPLVSELIAKTVQYLSVKDDKRKFKVYSSKSTYEENENVMLNAILYNDGYEAVNSPEVNVQVKNNKGKTFNYIFSKLDANYQLDAGILPEGTYSYIANTTYGDQNYKASGAFYINAVIAEYQQTTANHQLLNNMATQTNGKMVMPDKLLSIVDELEKSGMVKTISYEDRKFEELISFKWLFALIMILLSTEWFLRKRNGEA